MPMPTVYQGKLCYAHIISWVYIYNKIDSGMPRLIYERDKNFVEENCLWLNSF